MGFNVSLANIYEHVRVGRQKSVVDKAEKHELKIANFQQNHFFAFFLP